MPQQCSPSYPIMAVPRSWTLVDSYRQRQADLEQMADGLGMPFQQCTLQSFSNLVLLLQETYPIPSFLSCFEGLVAMLPVSECWRVARALLPRLLSAKACYAPSPS